MAPKRAANAAAFPAGAEVEVCNNTAGFRGSWYDATIVRAIPRRRSYDVEYVSRVADDDPTQPLRKTVLGSLVRPRRPRKVSSARYAVREHVDAYHNGGWRRGVVSALHGGDPPVRYTVKFTGSKEEIEFSPAEIRPHLEWRHGHWCPPERKRRGLPSLTSKNPGLPSSPFPSSPRDLEQANPMSLKRKMTGRPDSEGQNEAVVPKKVLKKEESLNPVGMEIEPKTPAIDKEVFGAPQDFKSPATELATSPENPLFDEPVVVAPQDFKSPATELATSQENPLFDEPVVDQRLVEGKTPATNKEVLIAMQNFESPATEAATSLENPLFDELGVEQRSVKGKSPIGLVVPGEKPSTTTDQMSKTQNVRHLFYNSLAGKLVLPNQWGNIKVRSPRENVGVQINTPATGDQRPQEIADLTGVKRHPSAEAKKRRGRPPKKSIDSAKKRQRRKPGDRVVKGSGKSSGANLYKQSLVSYVLDNVSCPSRQVEVMPSGSSAIAVKGVEERSPTEAGERVLDMVNVPLPSRQVEVVVPASSPVATKGAKRQPPTASDRVVAVPASSPVVVPVEERSPTKAGERVVDMVNVPLPSRQVEVVVPASSPVTIKGAKRQPPTVSDRVVAVPASSLVAIKSANLQPPTTSDRVASGNVPSLCRQVEVIMPASSPVAVEDVLVGAAMNNMETGLPTTHDVAPCTDTTTEGDVRVLPPPANVVPTPIVSVPTKLPFRKTSALWGEVESLEVFRAIPQDPHFALVEKQSGRDFCEGMAIGLMVTFDNLVKDIRKLDVTDSNQAFEDRLGSLRMLEENGFSVECLRTRIVELLQEKVRLGEIKNKTITLKEKVFGVSSEKEQINVTSIIVNKTIDEMKMRLARLNEKKRDLVTEEILKEAELAELQKYVAENVEAYRSGVQQFRRIAAAPW